MATTTKKTVQVTAEERDKRVKLAKALWFTEVGDDKPADGKERQAAFDTVKTDMIRKAIKLDKTLSRLGYQVTPSA